jgi:hypothetical protein
MLGLDPLSISWLLTFVVVLVIVRVLCTLSHRLYFHPLPHIPGPKLAALTFLYQTYFSLAGGSRFYAQIGKLHEKYGK